MFTVVHQVSLKSLLLDRGLIVRSKGELSNQCDIVSPKHNIHSHMFFFSGLFGVCCGLKICPT